MKVRVADVYRSGLHWEFVPSGTEEFTGDSSQQINFPPATDLFSTAIKGDPSLKDAEPELLDVGPPPAVLQPRNSNANAANSPLAPIEKKPVDTPEPVQHDDVATPKLNLASGTEETPSLPPLPGFLAVTETAAGEAAALGPLQVQPTPSPAQNINESVQLPADPIGIPPGFEIEVQAAVAPAPAPGAAPFVNGNGSGDVDLSGGGIATNNTSSNNIYGGFDYFTATQMSPATQGKPLTPSHAWAAGLPSPAAVGNLEVPRQPVFLQQQQQQHQVPPRENHVPPPALPVSRPVTAVSAQPPQQPPQPRACGAGARSVALNFKLNPEEAAARKSKLSAFQKELKSIFNGKDGEEDGSSARPQQQLPQGFQPAARVINNNVTKQQSPQPSPARLSPSTEILSDDMADQLSALEAAAIAAKEEKEKQNGAKDDDQNFEERKERKRSRSPEADSSHIPPTVGFMTGLNKAITIDPEALAAAKRLLSSPPDTQQEETQNLEKETEGAEDDVGVPETEEQQEEKAQEHPNKEENNQYKQQQQYNNMDMNNFSGGGFSTGLGKKVEIPPEQLAAAKRLLADIDNEDDTTPARTAPRTEGPSSSAQQQHNSRSTAVPPSASGVPANLKRGLSRLGPGGGTNTAGGGVAKKQQQQQQQPGRKGRGKFNTPRPAAAGSGSGGGTSAAGTPNSAMAAAATTGKPSYNTPGNIASKNANMHYTTAPGSADGLGTTPLHDLKSSALKTARGRLQSVQGNFDAPNGWPDNLPLNSLTAANYVFKHEDGQRSLGWEVLHQRLLSSGANRHYATEEWIQNHYRWVVWKLARAEFQIGPSAAGLILTPAILEDELRQRYEREFNKGHRPLLKAVFHQDESAAAVAVYMVASVRSTNINHSAENANNNGAARGTTTAVSGANNNTNATTTMLELTDGWYWIMAQCDAPLTNLILSGKISPGSKIRVMGGELVAPAGPADPLIAARSAHLRLHANGVHPVPDSTKLGRQAYRTSYLSLAAVHAAGGPIPQTLVVVLRRYPRLLWTKLPSGVATFQTPRAQAAAERTLQAELTKARVSAAAQVQAAELARCKQWLEKGKKDGMMTQLDRWYATVVVGNGGSIIPGGGAGDGCPSSQGQDFVRSLNTKDRTALERYISTRSAELEEETRRATEAALAADLPAARNAGSTEAAMLLVGEVSHEAIAKGRDLALGRRPPATALVTVWRPPEEFSTSIKEGEVFAVMGLEVSNSSGAGAAGGVGVGAGALFPDSILHLEAAPKRCHWRKVASSLAQLHKTLAGHAMPRAVPTLSGMGAVAAAAASEGQRAAIFDFTGVVLNAGPVYQNLNNSMYSHYQWIFFADASLEIGGKDAEEEDLERKNEIDEQWLLAVQLLGPQDAVSWLEPGEVGTVVTLHDLELSNRDEGSRIWRAAGGKHSAVVVVHNSGNGGVGRKIKRAAGGDPGVDAVVSWASENPEVVKSLQSRVEALLKG